MFLDTLQSGDNFLQQQVGGRSVDITLSPGPPTLKTGLYLLCGIQI